MCAMTYLGIAAKRSVKTDSNSRATDVGAHTHLLHAAEGAEGTGGVLNQHAQAANQQISKSAAGRELFGIRGCCADVSCVSICTPVLVSVLLY
jgi:hypothetical protein